MKKLLIIALGLCTVCAIPCWGQPLGAFNPNALGPLGHSPDKQLSRFNLDFPGGTPKELVSAIEKAEGKPLNVIIPEDDASTQLPALKMNNVDVSELFRALAAASPQVPVRFGNSLSYNPAYAFDNVNSLSDDTIWTFHVNKSGQLPSPPVCRFYALSRYLNLGLTVDDITTAIKTGWAMSGITDVPKISYHKETQLLIAVGDPDKLGTIEAVLSALTQQTYEPRPHSTNTPLPTAK